MRVVRMREILDELELSWLARFGYNGNQGGLEVANECLDFHLK